MFNFRNDQNTTCEKTVFEVDPDVTGWLPEVVETTPDLGTAPVELEACCDAEAAFLSRRRFTTLLLRW